MIDLSEYEDRYSRLTLGQSMKIAWRRMKDILFRPFSLAIFFLFALLGLFARLAGGMSLMNPLAVNDMGRLFFSNYHFGPAGIVAGIAGLTFGVVAWLYVEARLRLIYLDSLVQKKIRFLRAWKDLKGTGEALFRWEFFFTVVQGCYMVAFLWKPFGRFGTSLDFKNLLYTLAFTSSVLFLMLIDFTVLRLIMPLMFIKRTTFFPALRLFQRLYSDNKSCMASFFFTSLGISIGISIVLGIIISILMVVPMLLFFPSAFGGMGSASGVGLFYIVSLVFGLLAKFILGLFLQPIQLWYQAWGLAFYAGFGDDLNALITNGEKDIITGGPAVTELPGGVPEGGTDR